MIADIKAFLEADATLAALLFAGTGNTKIYYIGTNPGETTPYVQLSYSTDGTADDLLDEGILTISVFCETYEGAKEIVDRITEILDVQDGAVVASSRNRIFYAKKIGGGSDTQEEDTQLFHMARLLHVKYKRNTGG
ncbi:MAG: hypothetical protein WC655_27860 [Candidatus Hydrogenedentales bacterium]|jgi:hypothetical protein